MMADDTNTRLASTAAPVGLAEAAEALVAKLDSIDFASIGVMMHVRGMPYTGPTFGEELDTLKAAIASEQSATAATGAPIGFNRLSLGDDDGPPA